MPKLSDLKLSRFALLQTAQSGHGKTTRTLSAVRFGKVYIFDFDDKLRGAARRVPVEISGDWANDIEMDLFATCEAAMKKLKELVAMGDKLPYATVVVDTFTALNDLAEKEATPGAKDNFAVYKGIRSRLENFFDMLFTLRCNIIVNAHIMETTDEVTSLKRFGQAGKGSYRDDLARKSFTDQHYLVFADNKYKVRIRNSSTLPVVTSIDPKYVDKDGYATVFDLSILDEYAYRKDAK